MTVDKEIGYYKAKRHDCLMWIDEMESGNLGTVIPERVEMLKERADRYGSLVSHLEMLKRNTCHLVELCNYQRRVIDLVNAVEADETGYWTPKRIVNNLKRYPDVRDARDLVKALMD